MNIIKVGIKVEVKNCGVPRSFIAGGTYWVDPSIEETPLRPGEWLQHAAGRWAEW